MKVGRPTKLRFLAEQSLARNSVDLFVSASDEGRFAFGRPVEFEEANPAAACTDPFLSLEPTDAQNLMDELWRAGMRPSESRHVGEVLRAKDSHIETLEKQLSLLTPSAIRAPEVK